MTDIAITGYGAVSCLGLTADDFWKNICEGKSGIETIKSFDASKFESQLGGEVAEYKLRDYVPKYHRKATKLMSRDIELSVIAADEAVKSSGHVSKAIDAENTTLEPTRTAINLGAGLISCELVELSESVKHSITDGKFDIHKWGEKGLETLTPLWLLKYLPNMLACHIGIIHDIQGLSNTITCGEVSSYLAIAEAAQIIERGDADVALAGGGEAKVNPVVMLRQQLLKRATTSNDKETACRPFDAGADGSVFGEAAGIFVLENPELAKKRGAKIYATIAGVGQSASLNAEFHHIEADGKGITIAIEKAMAEAGISASDIDLIIPHGTAIAADDKAEAIGITNALGDAIKDIPVLPIKSMVANNGAASSALDMLAAVKAIETSTIPAARNCETVADGCELNINKTIQQKDVNCVLCVGYTFGGQTAAMVIKKYDGVS